MFRWPIAPTPLSLGSSVTSSGATLEVTPRGAVFTLAALAHVGHPAHLAVIDAYLKGQMRVSPGVSIGEDSRVVASALAGPLVAAHELAIRQLGLADLILLPPAATPAHDGLTRGPDSPRFLLRAPDAPDHWHWVRTAERFETPGCLGTPRPGTGSRWHDLVLELPPRPPVSEVRVLTGGLPAIQAELRSPTSTAAPPADLVAALRRVALDRFARDSADIGDAVTAAIRALMAEGRPSGPLAADDLQRERAAWRTSHASLGSLNLPALAKLLPDVCASRTAARATLSAGEVTRTLVLTPDLDGYQTLCLLPCHQPESPIPTFEQVRQATWDTLEAIVGRPLAEYRTEPISLRLVAADGRTTTLDVGVSVVIVRNQTVFTGWIGSDGRVMLKLFPPGGMGVGN
ncbi:MAG: hypothetical protein IT306_27295 [Chloroflexi bacterium]|nr:hypothetical protein [Chloroflexota bacterium]